MHTITVQGRHIQVLRYRRIELALSAQRTATRYVPVLMGDYPYYYVPTSTADGARLIRAGYERVSV